MAAFRRRSWLVVLFGVIALVAVAALVVQPRAGAVGTTNPDVASQLAKIKASLKDAKANLPKLQKALDDASGALNQAENELAAADQERLAARAEKAQAKTAMVRAADQLQQLRTVVGNEARSMYMSGSPTGLTALVQQDDANALLDQIATLDQLARANNDAITNMVLRQKEYATAQVALTKAEAQINASQAQIEKKIQEATELRNLRADAKDALDAKIADLQGEAAVLQNTKAQAAANQAGQVRTGTKCDLSGTSDAEYWIIMKESGGDPTADNPNSTAFGLGQLLLDLRQRLLGADYDTVDCAKQLAAFRAYVKERYGTAEAAKAFWEAHGWY